MTQTTISDGRRMSTARAYLEPARNRVNLKVQTGAMTEKLLFEGKRCVGVRYSVGGTVHEARVTREVMLSAGSINSPQLLELSGIGNPEVLKACGVNVLHDLPGVGENLRDQCVIGRENLASTVVDCIANIVDIAREVAGFRV